MAEMDKIFDKENLKDFWQILLNKLEFQEDGKHLSSNDLTDELKESLLSMDGKLRDAVANIYKIKGEVLFDDFPKEPPIIGDVYSIGSGFIADDRFIESIRGEMHPRGTNVVYTKDGWDILRGLPNTTNLIFKTDLVPISNKFIESLCQLPPIHCIIIIEGDTEFDREEFDTLVDPINISFDKYTNKIKTIYITAQSISDEEDGEILNSASSIFYYLSSAPLQLEKEKDTIDWVKYTTPFKLKNNGNWIVYAKIIDKIGKESYISTNGLVVDLVKPIAAIIVGNRAYSNELSPTELEVEIRTTQSQSVSISYYDEDTEVAEVYFSIEDYTLDTYYVLNSVADAEAYKRWSKYTSTTVIDIWKNTAYCVIYAKIVDKASNVTYIRSNPVVVDRQPPKGFIYINDLEFNTLKENPTMQRFTQKNVQIEFTVLNKIILGTKITGKFYYISDKLLPITALPAINWIEIPEEPIEQELYEEKNIIIYAKFVDELGNTAYINTDKLFYSATEIATLHIHENEYKPYHDFNPNYAIILERIQNLYCDYPDDITAYFLVDDHTDFSENDNVVVLKTKEKLNKIADSFWTPFNRMYYNIVGPFDTASLCVIYVKLVNQEGEIEYINSDPYCLITTGFINLIGNKYYHNPEIIPGRLMHTALTFINNEEISFMIKGPYVTTITYIIMKDDEINDVTTLEYLMNINNDEWNIYDDNTIVQITEPGFYIVYAKIYLTINTFFFIYTDKFYVNPYYTDTNTEIELYISAEPLNRSREDYFKYELTPIGSFHYNGFNTVQNCDTYKLQNKEMYIIVRAIDLSGFEGIYNEFYYFVWNSNMEPINNISEISNWSKTDNDATYDNMFDYVNPDRRETMSLTSVELEEGLRYKIYVKVINSLNNSISCAESEYFEYDPSYVPTGSLTVLDQISEENINKVITLDSFDENREIMYIVDTDLYFRFEPRITDENVNQMNYSMMEVFESIIPLTEEQLKNNYKKYLKRYAADPDYDNWINIQDPTYYPFKGTCPAKTRYLYFRIIDNFKNTSYINFTVNLLNHDDYKCCEIETGAVAHIINESDTFMIEGENKIFTNSTRFLGTYIDEGGNKHYTEGIEYPDDSNITWIKENACINNYYLKYIKIPNTITFIGESAFRNCKSLESFEFPNHDQEINIHSRCFYGCSSLKYITIPINVTDIPELAFSKSGLEEVIIEYSKSISNRAFNACDNLKKATIDCKMLYEKGFYMCRNLETVILSKNVELIGTSAFEECRKLNNIVIPDTVKKIGKDAFLNVPHIEYHGSLIDDNEGSNGMWGALSMN